MTDAEKNFVSIHNPSTGEVLHKFYYQFLSDKFIACPFFACVNEDDQLIVTDMRNNQIKVRLQWTKSNAKNDVSSRWVFAIHIACGSIKIKEKCHFRVRFRSVYTGS